MNDEEMQLMEKYGITSETKMLFHFQGHRYDRLDDAIKYAESRKPTSPSSKDQPIE